MHLIVSTLTYIFENGEEHPVMYFVIGFFLLRYALRWFLGITKLRREQRNYADMMDSHNALLQRQNQLLEQHSVTLDRIGKKYL